MTQTKNFEHTETETGILYTIEQDERFMALIEKEKETFVVIPEWQKIISKAGNSAWLGYSIAWFVAMDFVCIEEAQADLNNSNLGDIRDWVVALAFLEPQDSPEQPVDDPEIYDPECTDASNHFSPEDK